MYIKGLVLDRENESPRVLLRDMKNRHRISIDIGPFEANALIIELENIRMPRPLTHDIIAQLLKKHGFAIQYIELANTPDDGLTARICYDNGGNEFSLDVRPSDAMVLAAKTKASLYIRQETLRNCETDDGPASGAVGCEENEILFSSDDENHLKIM